MDDDPIRAIVARLTRPHPSGGGVIERAAVLAEGADSAAVLRWISDHGGEPEELASKKVADRGLHATRLHDHHGAGSQAPSRYVLPPEALAKPGGE